MAVLIGTDASNVIVAPGTDDSIFALGGHDTVVGGGGNDTAHGGTGLDEFRWFGPLDGNDSIDGGAASDLLVAIGTDGDDFIVAAFGEGLGILGHSGTGGQVNTVSIEHFQITPGAGADHVFVQDMLGVNTAVRNVLIEMGDNAGVVDGVTVLGPQLKAHYIASFIDEPGNAFAAVSYAQPTVGDIRQVRVEDIGVEDTFALIAGGSADEIDIDGSRNATVDGGGGNDILDWKQNFARSTGGRLLLDGGAGHDLVVTSDDQTVVSKAGTLVAVSHSFTGGANVAHLQGVEALRVAPVNPVVASASAIIVGDLSGTELREVSIDGASLTALRLTVDGSSVPEVITGVSESATQHVITGLPATVRIFDASATELTVRGGAGADTMNFSGIAPFFMRLTLAGGLNGDRIVGSRGADRIEGGAGADSLTGGAGDDVFFFDQTDPNRGVDVVMDFQPHDTSGFNDRIALKGIDFDDVTLRQNSGDTLIVVNGSVLARLVGVQASTLNASDFLAA